MQAVYSGHDQVEKSMIKKWIVSGMVQTGYI